MNVEFRLPSALFAQTFNLTGVFSFTGVSKLPAFSKLSPIEFGSVEQIALSELLHRRNNTGKLLTDFLEWPEKLIERLKNIFLQAMPAEFSNLDIESLSESKLISSVNNRGSIFETAQETFLNLRPSFERNLGQKSEENHREFSISNSAPLSSLYTIQPTGRQHFGRSVNPSLVNRQPYESFGGNISRVKKDRMKKKFKNLLSNLLSFSGAKRQNVLRQSC